MKVVILAGGLGTRISEESHLKPKPMIEVGEMPILWHIMKYYSSYGFNEFIILPIISCTMRILPLTWEEIPWKYITVRRRIGKLP